MNSAWLSILMPVYNGQAYLSQALESVIAQNEDRVECVAVDDGSTDATFSILSSYARKIPLKLIRQPRNCGWVSSTNRALRAATAAHCCILQHDDMWMGNRLRVLRNLLGKHPDLNMIVHPSWFMNTKGRRMGVLHCPLPDYPNRIGADLILEKLLVQNFISIPAPLFRRQTALEVGGMDESLWHTADWDFWLKIASHGKVVYYPRPLAAYRIHARSQTVLRSADAAAFREQHEIVFIRHLNMLSGSPSLKEKVRKAAVFSAEANVALASALHKRGVDFFRLVRLFFGLGPEGWHRYFRDSRIVVRVWARIRAGLLWGSGS